MRSRIALIFSVLTVSILAFYNEAAAYEAYNGCATPSTPVHAFYVDPVHGSMAGNGSAQKPWHTLAEVISAGLIGYQSYKQPYAPGSALLPASPKAVVHAGDIIYLLSGNHGDIYLRAAYNTNFITIAAAPGATPVLHTLKVGSGSYWVFDGLTIEGANTTGLFTGAGGNTYNDYNLVDIESNAWTGPLNNIIINGNTIQSQADVSSWSQHDWLTQRASGIYIRSSGGPMGSDPASSWSCFALTNNTIKNIGFAVNVTEANQVLIDNNTINYFSDDGIDYGSNNMLITNNVITNSIEDLDSFHRDGMQGQPLQGESELHTNINISNNIVNNQTDPKLAYPGYLQGIDTFDGVWNNLLISNNVVVTNAYHGIAYYGASNLTIVNNTVLAAGFPEASGWTATPDTDAVFNGGSTWITVQNAKVGTAPTNVVVRNNISDNFNLGISGTTADHNLLVTTATNYWDPLPAGSQPLLVQAPSDVFVDFDPATYKFDLHLKAGAKAIGAGNVNYAPATDITGLKRTTVDLGAYAYVPPATPTTVSANPVVSSKSTATSSTTSNATPSTPSNKAYNGTVTIHCNARQIAGKAPPQVAFVVDGQTIGTATITASMGAGQVGSYSFNFTLPQHPTKLDLILNGYTSTVQNYVSVDLFNVVFGATGTKGAEILSTLKTVSGNVSRYSLQTNGTTVEFNVAND